jgi:hypothetical protein
MRITQSTVEALAAEAEKAGVRTVESINHPGDGRTHYVMAESMTSTYYGARQAAAYILGVLHRVQLPVDRSELSVRITREIKAGQVGGRQGKAYDDGYWYAGRGRAPRV